MKFKFGTEGWRGIIADDFTFKNVKIVSAATVEYLLSKEPSNKMLCISYDRRFMSEDFAGVSAEVFSSFGFKVYLSDKPTPTPALSFYTNRKNLCAGVMFTASHNPYKYNGIKVKAPHGGPIPDEDAKFISERASEIYEEGLRREKKVEGSMEKINIRDFYIDGLIKLVNSEVIKKSKRKIFVDSMHGSGATYLSEALDLLGQEVDEIRVQSDPLFDGGKPEPVPDNLSSLKELCLKNSAPGFALDGDADRIAGFDEKGRFIDSHHFFSLILKHLVENRGFKGGVVKTITVTDMIDKLCNKYRLKLYTTPVGFKHASQIMSRGEAFLGGEESGGIGFTPHIPERDGSAIALLILDMISLKGQPLYRLIDDLHSEIGYHSFRRLDIEGERGERIWNEIESDIQSFEKKINMKLSQDIDGYKFREQKENGAWVAVRKSGTESLIRIYCEAESNQRVQEILDMLSRDK